MGISNEGSDQKLYRVVVNHEEQYSIWPADRALPAGWREVGEAGERSACLAYIEQVWTDMRPRSVRAKLDGSGS